jgi:hypothetical protein
MANLLEKASIVLTPTGYSRDAIHNVKPSESPFGDMTLIQNGTSTRINASGLVVDNTTDIPRIDYSKGSGAILAETAATNEIRYSEDFSNSLWFKTAVTLTSSTGINPRGESATIYAIQAVPSQGGLEAAMASSASGNGVGASIWARKKSGVGTADVYIGGGSFGNPTYATRTVGADWQRITFTSQGYTGTSHFFVKPVSILAADTIEIWGAQMEKSGMGLDGRVSSYIPTTSGSVTRTRDNYSNGGDASLIGAQEGVLFVEAAALVNSGVSRGIALSAANSNANRVALFYRSTIGQILVIVQGSSGYISLVASGVTQTNFNKIAVKYKSGDLALWVNGVEADTNTQNLVFNAALSELAFDQGNGSLHFDGHVKQLAVFKEILSDAELAALTS